MKFWMNILDWFGIVCGVYVAIKILKMFLTTNKRKSNKRRAR